MTPRHTFVRPRPHFSTDEPEGTSNISARLLNVAIFYFLYMMPVTNREFKREDDANVNLAFSAHFLHPNSRVSEATVILDAVNIAENMARGIFTAGLALGSNVQFQTPTRRTGTQPLGRSCWLSQVPARRPVLGFDKTPPCQPVGCSRHDGDELSASGHALFDQFRTVVTLHEQFCTQDGKWAALLDNVCMGCCTDDDISVLCSLILGGLNTPDFSTAVWGRHYVDLPLRLRHGGVEPSRCPRP
ncbi:hypothetical protein DFH07DRAFT_769507 [Mycena maculata]|uniref:Uncharacterized protein n=1 Tax=Mycena maculata TaxID=230809 RepID=A0AAD7JLF0_9AGAR|nr:hypothetical protein DFH07DRAFT_769507 [Mycena maculata]